MGIAWVARLAIGEVHQPETSREDLLDVVAVQRQEQLGAQAEAGPQAKRGQWVRGLGDAGVQERARLGAPERVDSARPRPRPLGEVLGFLRSLREPVAAGQIATADGMPHRQLQGRFGEELGRHTAQPNPRARPVKAGNPREG